MRLPAVEAQTVIKILQLEGYQNIRQSGSHIQFKNGNGTVITVPLHAGRPIGKGLLRKIIRDMEISREEFIALLKRV
ncbi:MAG: type II toxin-antitoxin system HicA family toxin [Candidatus Aenigmarchaeota archaeon]|nr:type II toxin-antitoxin system HicA family toxin [Candidatus Aenigmarchaeota archaeon]